MTQPQPAESVQVTLARIEEKLTNALAQQTEHARDIGKLFDSTAGLVTRVVKLETRLGAAWAAIGLLIAVAPIIALVLHR